MACLTNQRINGFENLICMQKYFFGFQKGGDLYAFVYRYWIIWFSASRDWIKTFLKVILPSHHTHELRYTFITRAKEAGCNLELVMLWDGHKFDAHVKSSWLTGVTRPIQTSIISKRLKKLTTISDK